MSISFFVRSKIKIRPSYQYKINQTLINVMTRVIEMGSVFFPHPLFFSKWNRIGMYRGTRVLSRGCYKSVEFHLSTLHVSKRGFISMCVCERGERERVLVNIPAAGQAGGRASNGKFTHEENVPGIMPPVWPRNH